MLIEFCIFVVWCAALGGIATYPIKHEPLVDQKKIAALEAMLGYQDGEIVTTQSDYHGVPGEVVQVEFNEEVVRERNPQSAHLVDTILKEIYVHHENPHIYYKGGGPVPEWIEEDIKRMQVEQHKKRVQQNRFRAGEYQRWLLQKNSKSS